MKPPEAAMTEHAWFREHLADFLLDLMDGQEAERLRSHASTCAECGPLLVLARAERLDGWLSADHPSPATLVRWHRDAAAVDREEARIIREHLEECGSCRADLAELAGARAVRAVPGAATPARPAVAGRRSAARDRMLGALGGALATAAAVLIVWPRPQAVPADGAAAPPPVASRAVVPEDPAPAFHAQSSPVQVSSRHRGESDTTRVVLDPGAPFVPLRIPTLFVPDSTPLAIELLDAAGQVAARMTMPARLAQDVGALLDTRGVTPGVHSLRVSWRAAGRDEHREYPIVFAAP